MITNKNFLDNVLNHTNNLKRKYNKISCLFNLLEKNGELILFGGAIRDLTLGHSPRDYDIVVNTENNDIEHIFSNYSFSKNSFGGYKINIDNIKLDIWVLKNTWAFHSNKVECHKDNLAKTVFFNADAIAVNLSSQEIYENGFFNAINNKCLEIILNENPYPALCVLRAFHFNYVKSFRFSEAIENYIAHWSTNVSHPGETLYTVQQKHYGEEIIPMSKLNDYLQKYMCKI